MEGVAKPPTSIQPEEANCTLDTPLDAATLKANLGLGDPGDCKVSV